MKRVVLSTFGSYGDINPYVSIGAAIRDAGAAACVVAPEVYRDYVLRHGLEFAPTRPRVDVDDTALVRKVMNPWTGAEFLTRRLLMPALSQSHADLYAACDGADFLLSHVLTYAGPIVAEQRQMPWATAFLQPMVLFSACDMPIVPPLTVLRRLRVLGPIFNRAVIKLMFSVSAPWGAPVANLRRELGLSPGTNPLIDAYRSPFMNLALFPRHFARAQPDWPTATELCGFPFLDEDFGSDAVARETAEFIDRGPPLVVITLGSAAVNIAGAFIERAVGVCDRLGMRTLVVFGPHTRCTDLPTSKNIHLVPSIPYFEVFPRADVIMHSGGIGTTAHALRAGVPQVIVPFAHDQFDNADRVVRLGCGFAAGSRHIAAGRLARLLERAIEDDGLRATCAKVAVRTHTCGAERAAALMLDRC